MPCAERKIVDVVELDEFHAHEALDRTCILMEIIEAQLMTHPYILTDVKKKALVGQAVLALCELYQLIGEEHL